jgi:alkylated DNA repair dioxygenase AlkB
MAATINNYFEYIPGFLPNPNNYYAKLMEEINFEQKTVKVFGKEYLEPRLTAVHGDDAVLNKTYTYSKSQRNLKAMTPTLKEIQTLLEKEIGIHFDFVLLNLYRDGHDRVSWHADKESEMDCSNIASISLGAARKFRFRDIKTQDKIWEQTLEAGSLVWMKPGCQQYLEHEVPKQLKVTASRINLTFRLFK